MLTLLSSRYDLSKIPFSVAWQIERRFPRGARQAVLIKKRVKSDTLPAVL
jgi:hypothetical protein